MLLKTLAAAALVMIAGGWMQVPSIGSGDPATVRALSMLQHDAIARLQEVKRDIVAARAHNP